MEECWPTVEVSYSRGIILRPKSGSFSAGFLAACKVSVGWSPLDFLMESVRDLASAAVVEGQALALCWRLIGDLLCQGQAPLLSVADAVWSLTSNHDGLQ
ncbi:hypothetical protein Nepgr_023079 [Nepenthes gracilis]|uniref:Uncharacterized protein n=1 Tax=Nepenthes gracilis TaxID=150966 RepID=A0AAD3XXE0_NEPGR|nr:hypothetical protein Nepgr_023079 [Nepenthes gracilis]